MPLEARGLKPSESSRQEGGFEGAQHFQVDQVELSHISSSAILLSYLLLVVPIIGVCVSHFIINNQTLCLSSGFDEIWTLKLNRPGRQIA